MSEGIQGSLDALVGSTGQISLVYGGFEIKVLNPAQFPWERVLHVLLALELFIWIEKREGSLVIQSKPSPV